MSTTQIDAMFAAAGLDPPAEDRAKIVEFYELMKPSVAALYAVPETRYEVPALVFQAAPKLAEW